MSRAETPPPRRVLVVALLILNAIVWVALTASLLFFALIASAPFFGEQPTAIQLARTHDLLGWAAAVALALPIAGLVGGALVRSSLAIRTSAVMLVLGLATCAGIVLWIVADSHRG